MGHVMSSCSGLSFSFRAEPLRGLRLHDFPTLRRRRRRSATCPIVLLPDSQEEGGPSEPYIESPICSVFRKMRRTRSGTLRSQRRPSRRCIWVLRRAAQLVSSSMFMLVDVCCCTYPGVFASGAAKKVVGGSARSLSRLRETASRAGPIQLKFPSQPSTWHSGRASCSVNWPFRVN